MQVKNQNIKEHKMNGDIIPGTIDMHIHTAPDIAPRKVDDLTLAKAAADAGMGGFIIKSHLGSSVERAYMVNQQVPNIRAFGSVVLNYPIGGLNPFAVDSFVRLGAKEVWMPTLSAQHTLTYQKEHVPFDVRVTFNQAHGGALSPPSMKVQPGDPWPWSNNGKGITIFGENGKIIPEVWTILEIVAASETILGTGHLSVPETHALVDAAKQMGVKRILATHPEYMAPLSLDDQLVLAKKGVYFERCFVCTTEATRAVGGPLPFSVIVNNIRAVGVASTVLGTDFGQAVNIHPVAAMEEYQKQLRQAGFNESEIETMAVKMPKALLGT
jgi:Family of unknown function (DUF6282)